MMQNVTALAGTTLFHVAAKYFNDPTQWYRVAQVNGLNDVLLEVMTTLTIPPVGPAGGQPGSRRG